MKKYLKIILMFSLLFTLCACNYPGSPAAEGHYAPYYILQTNVPFADNLHTYQWDKVSLLQTDGYGRKYYVYRTPSIMLHSEIEVHVICQAESAEGYGYYSDCYLLRCIDEAGFTSEAIDLFLQQNDWDLPIKLEKISYCSSEKAQPPVVYSQTFETELRRHLGLSENYRVLSNSMERLSDTIQIFFSYVFQDDIPAEESSYYYLVLYNSMSPQPVVECYEIPISSDWQASVKTLREAWQNMYG